MRKLLDIKLNGDFKHPILLIILIVLLALAISWGVTIAIIKLITICFGLKFNTLIATGIWLIMLLASSIFGGNTNVV